MIEISRTRAWVNDFGAVKFQPVLCTGEQLWSYKIMNPASSAGDRYKKEWRKTEPIPTYSIKDIEPVLYKSLRRAQRKARREEKRRSKEDVTKKNSSFRPLNSVLDERETQNGLRSWEPKVSGRAEK